MQPGPSTLANSPLWAEYLRYEDLLESGLVESGLVDAVVKHAGEEVLPLL